MILLNWFRNRRKVARYKKILRYLKMISDTVDFQRQYMVVDSAGLHILRRNGKTDAEIKEELQKQALA